MLHRHAHLPADVLTLTLALRVAAAGAVPGAGRWWNALAHDPAQLGPVAREMADELPRVHTLAPHELPPDDGAAALIKDLTMPPTEPVADLIGSALLGSVRQQQRSGQFFTPTSLADLMAAINPAQPGMYVVDPACGAGALLLASHTEARARLGGAARTITYLGVDLDPRCARAAGLVLWATGLYEQSHVFCADALTHALAGADDTGELRRLDAHLVLGNPPFGTRQKLSDGAVEPLIVPPEVLWRQWPRSVVGAGQEMQVALDRQRLLER